MDPPEESRTDGLERFRPYLLMLARAKLAQLRGKLDASDVVQQSLLEAYQDWQRFQWRSEGELLAWLRQILAHNLADALRAFRRAKRDVARERSVQQALDQSSVRLEAWLAAEQSTPSQQVSRQEEAVLLARALGNFRPANVRRSSCGTGTGGPSKRSVRRWTAAPRRSLDCLSEG